MGWLNKLRYIDKNGNFKYSDLSSIDIKDVSSTETIAFFIGKYDINGNMIYEGDIITANGKYPKIVKYIHEKTGFCIYNIHDIESAEYFDIYQQPFEDWWDEVQIKIVGNIFKDNVYEIEKIYGPK